MARAAAATCAVSQALWSSSCPAHIAGIFMEVAWSFARLLSGATLRPEWAGVAIAAEQRAAIVHGALVLRCLPLGQM